MRYPRHLVFTHREIKKKEQATARSGEDSTIVSVMGGEELTEQETEVYDRQIRVWGVDAQRRLGKARVLVSGINGTTAEFCKNIVLAGVGSLTLMDDTIFTDSSIHANFLIPPDQSLCSGKSLSEICCNSLRDFNNMVRVSTAQGDLSVSDVDFYNNYDVVVVSSCSLAKKILISEKCRKVSRGLALYMVDCKDSFGEIFIDLQDYTYSKKNNDTTTECLLSYPSFKEAITIPWNNFHRKMSKVFFTMRVLERFEENVDESQLASIVRLCSELCQEQEVSDNHIPAAMLKKVVTGMKEFPPVCAILGGILGQEVIKWISGKGDPIKNFFFFNVMDGKGIIEDVSPSNYPT